LRQAKVNSLFLTLPAAEAGIYFMLTREQKENVVEELVDKIKRQKSIAFIDFEGLKVRDFSALRKNLAEVGGEARVAKKTLVKLAFEESGFEFKGFEGQLGLVFGFDDKIKHLKKVYEVTEKNENLEILGGFSEGRFLEKEKVVKLAQLPSKKQLQAQFVRQLNSPMTSFVNVLQANIKGLIYTLDAIKSNKQ